MSELKNMDANHSLVEDGDGKEYLLNHNKKSWYDSSDDDEFEVYPIDENGYADFSTIIVKKKTELNPKFFGLRPK